MTSTSEACECGGRELLRLEQPRHSRLCGQTCVAMLGAVTLPEAITLVGHAHSTRTREMSSALRGLGFVCQERLYRKRAVHSLPKHALLRLRGGAKEYWSHWVVYWHGKVLDPYYPTENHWPVGVHVSSFLDLYQSMVIA